LVFFNDTKFRANLRCALYNDVNAYTRLGVYTYIYIYEFSFSYPFHPPPLYKIHVVHAIHAITSRSTSSIPALPLLLYNRRSRRFSTWNTPLIYILSSFVNIIENHTPRLIRSLGIYLFRRSTVLTHFSASRLSVTRLSCLIEKVNSTLFTSTF